MLLDVTKFPLTVGLIGTLTNNQMNVKNAVIGFAMILSSWTLGVLIIPQDKNGETK